MITHTRNYIFITLLCFVFLFFSTCLGGEASYGGERGDAINSRVTTGTTSLPDYTDTPYYHATGKDPGNLSPIGQFIDIPAQNLQSAFGIPHILAFIIIWTIIIIELVSLLANRFKKQNLTIESSVTPSGSSQEKAQSTPFMKEIISNTGVARDPSIDKYSPANSIEPSRLSTAQLKALELLNNPAKSSLPHKVIFYIGGFLIFFGIISISYDGLIATICIVLGILITISDTLVKRRSSLKAFSEATWKRLHNLQDIQTTQGTVFLIMNQLFSSDLRLIELSSMFDSEDLNIIHVEISDVLFKNQTTEDLRQAANNLLQEYFHLTEQLRGSYERYLDGSGGYRLSQVPLEFHLQNKRALQMEAEMCLIGVIYAYKFRRSLHQDSLTQINSFSTQKQTRAQPQPKDSTTNYDYQNLIWIMTGIVLFVFIVLIFLASISSNNTSSNVLSSVNQPAKIVEQSRESIPIETKNITSIESHADLSPSIQSDTTQIIEQSIEEKKSEEIVEKDAKLYQSATEQAGINLKDRLSKINDWYTDERKKLEDDFAWKRITNPQYEERKKEVLEEKLKKETALKLEAPDFYKKEVDRLYNEFIEKKKALETK